VPKLPRFLLVGLTLAVIVATSLPNVPRAWVDYEGVALLEHVDQPALWGTDTIADIYEARVVLNDPLDMYTKRGVAQTPIEAATWTKEQSAPYPPVTLLAIAGLHAIGEALGVGYYGMVLLLAMVFVGGSLVYFWRTRWYLFPILYLNFAYFSERFVHVQDGSYLLMLVVVLAALWLARAGRRWSHVLMAVATTLKLSPVYYVRHLRSMPRGIATLYVVILFVGLVLPYFVLENYLYIYTFGYGLRGEWDDAAGALFVAGLFAVVLAYVEWRRPFDLEDRIGWALVPAALFLALKLNAPRHLLIVLLVPDKRGLRNVAAAVGLGLHTLLPSVVAFGSTGPIAGIILLGGLLVHVRDIGWATVRQDLRRLFSAGHRRAARG